MTGYSKTPLLQKLGFKPEQVNFVDSVAPYFNKVKDDITLNATRPYDFIHIFVRNRSELTRSMTFALTKLAKESCQNQNRHKRKHHSGVWFIARSGRCQSGGN